MHSRSRKRKVGLRNLVPKMRKRTVCCQWHSGMCKHGHRVVGQRRTLLVSDIQTVKSQQTECCKWGIGSLATEGKAMVGWCWLFTKSNSNIHLMRKTKEKETCKQQEQSHTLLMWAQDKNSAQATARCKNETQNFRAAFLVNSLALKQHTVYAMGMGGHCYAHLKGKQQANIKGHQSWIAEKDFSQQILEQKQPGFLHNTQCNNSRDTIHPGGGGEKGFPGATAAVEGGLMVVKKIYIESYVKLKNLHRILCEIEQYWVGQGQLSVTMQVPVGSGNLESTIWNSHCFDGI